MKFGRKCCCWWKSSNLGGRDAGRERLGLEEMCAGATLQCPSLHCVRGVLVAAASAEYHGRRRLREPLVL